MKINSLEWKREVLLKSFTDINGDRLKEHYDDDSGWVEISSYIKSIFDQGCEDLFDKVSANGCSECKYCQHNESTTDAFGTGDSPTDFECTNSESSDCPYVFENIETILD
tara:strand:- start:856 stop:1185 length:330 start_codon:yes stop_codon:yes gene_type:complete